MHPTELYKQIMGIGLDPTTFRLAGRASNQNCACPELPRIACGIQRGFAARSVCEEIIQGVVSTGWLTTSGIRPVSSHYPA